VTEGVVETATADAPGTVTVFCPAAYPYADGGGGNINVPSSYGGIEASYPLTGSSGDTAATSGEQATGWAVSYPFGESESTITVYVTCSNGSAVPSS
jgi:hypothetical protein